MQYVADHGSTLSNLDAHFKPTNCDPCFFPFDLIIKAETWESSSEWVLKKKLRYDTMRSLNEGVTRSPPEGRIREMFSKLKRDTIVKVMAIYKREMDIFGYTFDLDTLTAGGWDD